MTSVQPGQPAQSVEMGGSQADTTPLPEPLNERDLHFSRYTTADHEPHAADSVRVVHKPTGHTASVDVGPDESYMQARHRLLGVITEKVHAL